MIVEQTNSRFLFEGMDLRKNCRMLYYRKQLSTTMMKLIACDWIRKHQNIIITGPTGAGKTFIACALANKACREGYRSFYIRSPRFSYQMSLAKGDGSYGNIINKFSRAHVLVFDDLGLAPLTDM